MRADLERMVDQIEAETSAAGTNGGKGCLPSFFATFTCAVYKWEQLHIMLELVMPPESLRVRVPMSELSVEEQRRRYFKDAADNPGLVSWYCAIKLEQMAHLAVAVISRQLRDYQLDSTPVAPPEA